MNDRKVSTPVASAAPVTSPVISPGTTTVPIPAIVPPYPSTDWVRKPRPNPLSPSIERQKKSTKPVIHYPESDDMPMAENTEQYQKLTTIKGNLEYLFRSNPNVFIAGDLFWYPVEGRNDIVYAPDVMVAFGRPKGKRGSYMQWVEGNTPPQVVFEIWSPGNSKISKDKKFVFYQEYGVEEYYTYDPDKGIMEGWLRKGRQLKKIPNMLNWRSPCLNVKFTIEETPDGLDMQLHHPDGAQFLSHQEDLEMRREESTARVAAEFKALEEAAARAEAELKINGEAAARAEAEAKAQEETAARAEAEAKAQEETAARVEAEAKAQEESAARAEAETQVAAIQAEAESKINEADTARMEAEMKIKEAEAEAERMQALLHAALEQLQKAGLSLPEDDK